MLIDAIIAFGGIFLLAVIGFVIHWWMGVQLRRDAERERTGNERPVT